MPNELVKRFRDAHSGGLFSRAAKIRQAVNNQALDNMQASGSPAASKATGTRFAHLRMGRDFPAGATAPAPTIKRAAASLPAAKPAASAEQERARIKAVASSEHSIGRERMALTLLGMSPSAEEITGLLAKLPKAGSAAADGMLARLISQPNPQLGTGSESDGSREGADVFWARARAANERHRSC